MTDWAIRIPHRDRDESLIDVGSNCRHLDADEAAPTRAIVMEAAIGGMKTAGDLLDHLEALEPAQRRQMLDEARAGCGLEPTAAIDVRDHLETLRRQNVSRSPIPECAAVECTNVPLRMGIFYDPNVNRWHCPTHENLAEPGDMDERGSGIKYSPGGVPIDDDPAADQAERQREETRRERLRAQGEIRAIEHAELIASKAANDEAARSTLAWEQARR